MISPFEPIEFPFDEKYIEFRELIKDVTEASTKLGEFNERMNRSKFGHTYSINHLLSIESLYSTRIEGTQTSIDAVYTADTDDKAAKDLDVNEVLRYKEALNTAAKEVVDNPITVRLLKHIHEILLSGAVRKNSSFIAGEFRTQQNRVGEHIPPVAADVPKWMGNLERYINNDYNYEDNLPPIIKAALIHAQFETIHPFPDGNGRVGRVLIPIYLYKQGVISSPFFFLSQELERNSMRYYSFLQGTRSLTPKGFTDWIKFFLTSITNQATRDITFFNDLDGLYERVCETFVKCINSRNSETVVKAIFKFPIFSIDKLCQETGINETSLRKYVKILREQNILFKDQKTRNSKYYFMELIDILQK